jgi:DNA (cytosine-5)-methyltransferase 1
LDISKIEKCARIQTFPDDFLFKYQRIADGYKMVGNAVPVDFAKQLAMVIYNDMREHILSASNESIEN